MAMNKFFYLFTHVATMFFVAIFGSVGPPLCPYASEFSAGLIKWLCDFCGQWNGTLEYFVLFSFVVAVLSLSMQIRQNHRLLPFYLFLSALSALPQIYIQSEVAYSYALSEGIVRAKTYDFQSLFFYLIQLWLISILVGVFLLILKNRGKRNNGTSLWQGSMRNSE